MAAKKNSRKKSKKHNVSRDVEDESAMDSLPEASLDEKDFTDIEDSEAEDDSSRTPQKARDHVEQLHRLEEKDPEFYQFLKEHDKELLDFDDDGINEDDAADVDQIEPEVLVSKLEQKPAKVITTAMVDSWCNAVHENGGVGPVRCLLRAFRTACHYGDDDGGDSSEKFRIMSNSVFNRIMIFVLSEMDGLLRELLRLPFSGGKKETIVSTMKTKGWKTHGSLVKSYLGNALHVLNQMTDSQMISFTLRRLRYSAVFLAAFPSLLRRYIKVALHFWGTGGGALPVVSFLFLRDLCIRMGSDCLDTCLKGIYKAYVLNCRFITATKLQHIQFLGNCVIELYGIDLPNAYQHAFGFIRQMAMILRDALTTKTKEAFGKVYEWKFMNCLELWTGMVCAYSTEADFQPLAYPLTQIVSGVAQLNPTARFLPLRLRCAKMLNRLGSATGTYIPVSLLLLDMLEMKELKRRPTGGVGKAIDLCIVLKVSKDTLKTRSFQESCIFSVVEQLADHLAQWTYSAAFFELSYIPLVLLRSFCKSTKVERFHREMKQLIRQIEASCEFTNRRRVDISFAPNDPAVASFLKSEKDMGASPLSQYAATLRARAEERSISMVESSVIVGAESSVFGSKIPKVEEDESEGVEEGTAVFSSSWLPGNNSMTKAKKSKGPKRQCQEHQHDVGPDDDVVEDLVLSSDEGEPVSDSPLADDEGLNAKRNVSSKQGGRRPNKSKKRRQSHSKKPKARKKAKK